MVDEFQLDNPELVGKANIKVVGVGGGGQNAVSRMYRERIPSVEYITINTDRQALEKSEVPIRIRVGRQNEISLLLLREFNGPFQVYIKSAFSFPEGNKFLPEAHIRAIAAHIGFNLLAFVTAKFPGKLKKLHGLIIGNGCNGLVW